jgi:hypothetical protein
MFCYIHDRWVYLSQEGFIWSGVNITWYITLSFRSIGGDYHQIRVSADWIRQNLHNIALHRMFIRGYDHYNTRSSWYLMNYSAPSDGPRVEHGNSSTLINAATAEEIITATMCY